MSDVECIDQLHLLYRYRTVFALIPQAAFEPSLVRLTPTVHILK
jgi:hypothetical protein